MNIDCQEFVSILEELCISVIHGVFEGVASVLPYNIVTSLRDVSK